MELSLVDNRLYFNLQVKFLLRPKSLNLAATAGFFGCAILRQAPHYKRESGELNPSVHNFSLVRIFVVHFLLDGFDYNCSGIFALHQETLYERPSNFCRAAVK